MKSDNISVLLLWAQWMKALGGFCLQDWLWLNNGINKIWGIIRRSSQAVFHVMLEIEENLKKKYFPLKDIFIYISLEQRDFCR